MSHTALFPAFHIKPLYYNIHIRYLIEYFRWAGYEIETKEQTSTSTTSFTLELD